MSVEIIINRTERKVSITVERAGIKGDTGKSAYQSYLDTTTDNPTLTEAEWSDYRPILPPNDGKIYGIQNGVWVEIGGVTPPAPTPIANLTLTPTSSTEILSNWEN